MPIMSYNTFKEILNKTIFEKSKSHLLEKISNYPQRFVGLFRPTKSKAKILQNLLQSHEILFGNALEIVLEEYFKLNDFNVLCKTIKTKDNETLNLDLFFEKNNLIYFIEVKVRDDHDSTKKRGQIKNFEIKLNEILSLYPKYQIVAIFYFIDDSLHKNKNFYFQELSKIKNDYNINVYLFYGSELFNYFNFGNIWDEIIKYLAIWKQEIPDLPETNFDLNPEETFEEIKKLKPYIFRNLFNNKEILSDIIPTLFPEKKTLNLLYYYFLTKEEAIYKNLALKLKELL